MDEIEIPEAIREDVEVEKSRLKSLPLIAVSILVFGMAGLFSMFLLSPTPKSAQEEIPPPTSKPVSPKASKQPPKSQSTPTSENTPRAPDKAIPSKTDLLGHLPYDVSPESELEAITADNRLQMRSAAAKKFQQMQTDARADGVILAPISAFRTASAQEQLFFGVKEQRVQDATKRAEVSAPPGYSEHHTGYAIDIGDGNAPATNLETDFENTAAFIWLKQNAPKYSFELSFPPGNEQGISYEPWHWRFVGDRHSLETFYKVRN